ncbi:cytochrome c [Afifella sp. IM 167]|uniref:c-type cytochrome n=1 Tax=Afifella sp. IM 167 TaxID=2033586 RepID=UPI001CCA2BE9|nr:cytochrome c [Afifella sp. IM 167]MBZ8133121.1 cytochrome C signal peptide protein [Afifella sp. IM 167]
MIRSLTLALLVSSAVAVGAAYAQDMISGEDAISARQSIMKSFGASAKVGGGMMKGEIPYNPAVGAMVIATINAGAHSVGHFFPEDSKTGGDTEASPKIWEDMAGFNAKIEELQSSTEMAMASPPADLDAFKAAFGDIAKNCKSCHEDYKLDKN